MNSVNIKRTLSFVLMNVFAFVMAASVHAMPIAVTPYASAGCTTITTTLSQGKRGSEVVALQDFLRAHGYFSVASTGYFGPLTRSAVVAFQAKAGVGIDGIVGVQTRAHIFATDCAGSTLPSTAVTITAITPIPASSGTTVTITGTGFNSSSVVRFAIGGITNGIVGNNGTTLTFTVPSSIGPYCKANEMCAMYLMLVNNGTYPVYVQNADGSVSNTVQFTVAGNTNLPIPSVQ